MTIAPLTGSCLCGSVQYQFVEPIKVFQYCHCSRCQKVTGSAHAANLIIDPKQFQWLRGKDCVRRFELPEAKHFATSFCAQCGAALPWKTQSGRAVIVPAGSLDSDPKIKPMHNIYIANMAPWYTPVDSLIKYNALPVK